MSWTIEEIEAAAAKREELKSLRVALKAYEETRDTLSAGKERRAVMHEIRKGKAQIEAVNEVLKDAPPLPISPDEAKAHILAILQDARADWEKTKADFVRDAELDPVRAIEYAKSVVKVQTLWKLLLPIMREAEKEDSTLSSITEVLETVAEEAKSDFHSLARNPTNSTCQFHNAVQLAKLEELASSCVVDGGYGWSTLRSAKMYLTEIFPPRIEVWKILQGS